MQGALIGLVTALLVAVVVSLLTHYREVKLLQLRSMVDLYVAAVEPFADLVAEVSAGRTPDLRAFDRERFKAEARLALFAPQEVLDAFDRLVDFVLDCFDRNAPIPFKDIRSLAYSAVNVARRNLRIPGEITYKGQR